MSEKILTFLERVEMNLPVTAQEVFDQAVGGVIRQGRPSGEVIRKVFKCLYRDSQGGACALGQCVPDSMYDPGMEHTSADELFIKGFGPKSLEPHRDLLGELQDAHDGEYRHISKPWVESFKSEAKDVAHRFGLDWKF